MSEINNDPESSVVEMVGRSYSGSTETEILSTQGSSESSVGEVSHANICKFSFDAEFQSRVLYLAIYDQSFMRRVAHLLKPDYFEFTAEAAFMVVVLNHWKNYQSVMGDNPVIIACLKDAKEKKLLRQSSIDEIKIIFRDILEQRQAIRRGDIEGLNAEFIADKVAEFVRQQAFIAAISKSVDLIDKGDYAKIEKLVLDANRVGIEKEENGGEYFERLLVRTNERANESAGLTPPRGITTGHLRLDNLLYHRGWGRKELSVLMGGPKAGKTTALIEFASAACMTNFNVLYVTLEVSNRIVEERADARFTDTPISDLVGKFADVNAKVEALSMRSNIGRFYIAEYPSGSMSPSMLSSLMERHKSKGWVYDMVVVDYADIMTADFRTNDPIENSKQVYLGLRAIAQEWNCAMLTATQSNRDGSKAIVAKSENVADDFNKVRTADLFISINSTEEEKRDNKARLYFAAARNSKSGMAVSITQDFNRGRFLKTIEGIE